VEVEAEEVVEVKTVLLVDLVEENLQITLREVLLNHHNHSLQELQITDFKVDQHQHQEFRELVEVVPEEKVEPDFLEVVVQVNSFLNLLVL